jgi:opacity protein-like surface antigen
MKTCCNLFIFVFLFCLSTNLSAQFGIRAGVNFANLSIDNKSENFDPGNKLGLGVGVFYKLSILDNFMIQPEFNFIQHGAKSVTKINGIEATNTFGFNYVQVPVLLKFGFGDMVGLNFYVQGGPYIGIGIGNAKSEYCYNGKCDLDESNYGDEEDEIKNPDFGAQMGAGLMLNRHFFFDFRYILGMQILQREDEMTVKHNGINLSVGYAF